MEDLKLFIVKNKDGKFAKWSHPFSFFDSWVDEYDKDTCVGHNSGEVLKLADKFENLEIHVVEPDATDIIL